MKILVVEDDVKIARSVREGLEAEGHEVEVAADGASGLRSAQRDGNDLLLLDLSLPELDGLELLRRLRQTHPGLPVIAITARGEVEDRVLGLDEGADDYLVKPFGFFELLARIRALFRRAHPPQDRHLTLEALVVDRVQRTAHVGEASVELSEREFQLLIHFVQHPDEPQSRAVLADRVWGYAVDSGTNVIDVYVNYVRKKLRQLGLEPIRTLRGIGYVLEREGCAGGPSA